ncbi:MAG TPA: isocitrate lyase/phosphoenolpyruvate mutase family protein [Alphaproteobacteria bacterium]|nr:isocitrate lyase/phosphoenolpyruvate mutase family protein [Alphaproteobacteria bacterium]
MNQQQKAEAFRALHQAPGLFVIPNPWDAGSARLLQSLGFRALTTTSAGLAWAIGKADGAATREESLANAAAVVNAVDLPVAADLENGFGDRPEEAAETIRMAADVGLVGASIEDWSRDQERIYDLGLAVERIAAAVEMVRSLGFPFQLVGRAENHVHGIDDLDDTIRRLVAYERAGADVLFAPWLPSLEAIRTVCRAVAKPVNVVVGPSILQHSLAELAEVGVKRVSVGGSFTRVAYAAVREAAEELLGPGTLSWGRELPPNAEFNALMRRGP